MPNIKYLKIKDFAKGLNTFERDTMLKDTESAQATNVMATGSASITKRSGVSKLGEIAGVSQVDGLGTYTTGATRGLLAMAGGKLYRVETGTAVQVSALVATATYASGWTSGLRTDFCQAGGYVFISNGTDGMRQYNGTNYYETTNGVVAKYMIYYKNCLYAAGNTTWESRVYRSGSGTYLGNFTYSTANTLAATFDVSINDGQKVTSFFKHQDYLYVTKNRTIHRLSVGSDALGLLSSELVDPARGAETHWASDAVENDIFIFNEQGVHAMGYEPNYLDQIRTKIVSKRVDPNILNVQKTQLDSVTAMYSGGRYYMAYTAGGGTSNDSMLVYDRLRSSWWLYSLAAECMTEYQNTSGYTYLYYGSPTDGSIYYINDAVLSDNAWTIPTVWKSPKLSMDDYVQSKFFLKVEFYVGKKSGTIDIAAYVDGTLIKSKTIDIGNTGLAGEGVSPIGTSLIGVGGGGLEISDSGGSSVVELLVNKMGRNIQLEIQDNTSDKSWELNAVEVSYVPINQFFQPGVK